MHTMLRVWAQAGEIYRKDVIFLPYMPLWGNPQQRQLTQIAEPQLGAVRGVVALKHVITDRRISTFAVLRNTFALPVSMSFCYFQLGHALQAQFQ